MRKVAAARLFASALALISVAASAAHSPWLPEQGQIQASTVASYESFDEFHHGTARSDFSDGAFR